MNGDGVLSSVGGVVAPRSVSRSDCCIHCRCEGMSTYPRTYDLIHADSVFALYKNR